MLFVRASQAAVLITALAVTPAFASRTHRAATSGHQRVVSSKKSHSLHLLHKLHGQRSIDPARATQIQQALIRQNYLSGSPSGQWDSATQAAMQKYQADHGWQTKLMPDSRALISLGLGPNHSGEVTQASKTVQNLPTVSEAGSETGDGNTLASVHSIPSP
jgi:Putative peptidoglycan binding domain